MSTEQFLNSVAIGLIAIMQVAVGYKTIKIFLNGQMENNPLSNSLRRVKKLIISDVVGTLITTLIMIIKNYY